jgi:hypothetical protein
MMNILWALKHHMCLCDANLHAKTMSVFDTIQSILPSPDGLLDGYDTQIPALQFSGILLTTGETAVNGTPAAIPTYKLYIPEDISLLLENQDLGPAVNNEPADATQHTPPAAGLAGGTRAQQA